MKKLFSLAIVLVFAAGFCFAQEESEGKTKHEFDLEITAGLPIHWTNFDYDNGVDLPSKLVVADTAFGVAGTFNFNKRFGLTLEADLSFAGAINGWAGNGSDYNSIFTANALLGPVIYIYNGNYLRIPLAFGIHAFYYSDSLWVPALSATNNWIKRTDLELGVGTYIGIQFHFNENLYIVSKTNVNFDLYRIAKTKGGDATTDYSDSDTGFAFSWGVKPTLGLGIKF
jgi:hypothetical protein